MKNKFTKIAVVLGAVLVLVSSFSVVGVACFKQPAEETTTESTTVELTTEESTTEEATTEKPNTTTTTTKKADDKKPTVTIPDTDCI